MLLGPTLPASTAIEVLSHLDAPSLASTSATSRHLHRVIFPHPTDDPSDDPSNDQPLVPSSGLDPPLATSSSASSASSATSASAAFVPGAVVEGRYKGKKWFPGRVTATHADGTVDIEYHDGDCESRVEPACVRRRHDAEGVRLPRASSELGDEAVAGSRYLDNLLWRHHILGALGVATATAPAPSTAAATATTTAVDDCTDYWHTVGRRWFGGLGPSLVSCTVPGAADASAVSADRPRGHAPYPCCLAFTSGRQQASGGASGGASDRAGGGRVVGGSGGGVVGGVGASVFAGAMGDCGGYRVSTQGSGGGLLCGDDSGWLRFWSMDTLARAPSSSSGPVGVRVDFVV